MYMTLAVDKPIEKVVEDWDFLEDRIASKFSAWRTVGQNIYGIRRRSITKDGIIDPRKGAFNSFVEMGPDGIIECHFEPMRFHITTGGTPHRVNHSMGFWHINDMDELYLPLPNAEGEDLGHFIVIMQNPTGREGESHAFYCRTPGCMTMLYEHYYNTGTLGLAGIWKSEELSIREFNRDPKKRTCPDCGAIHPLGYMWNTAKDTPEERAAREIW